MIIAGGGLMTAGAHRLCAAARSHVDLDNAAFRAKPRLLVDEARKVMAVVEEGDQPHASKVQNHRRVDCQFARHVTSRTGARGCRPCSLMPRSTPSWLRCVIQFTGPAFN